MSKLHCLALCNGANSQLKYHSELCFEEFKADILKVCSTVGPKEDKTIMIVNYSRKVINQTGTGHFSPIGGYNCKNDMVLIMDVARFKHPPHWIPLSLLFAAMKDIEPDSNKSRGYLLISASKLLKERYEKCSCTDEGGNGVESQSADGLSVKKRVISEIITQANQDIRKLQKRCCPV